MYANIPTIHHPWPLKPMCLISRREALAKEHERQRQEEVALDGQQVGRKIPHSIVCQKWPSSLVANKGYGG